MSAETRQAIAAAASTVEGIHCSPYFRQSLAVGQGSVRLNLANRSANGIGFVNTWQVWVALSQDVATAERWLDEHLDELATALDAELIVTTITPAELAFAGGGSINGVIVEGARAAG